MAEACSLVVLGISLSSEKVSIVVVGISVVNLECGLIVLASLFELPLSLEEIAVAVVVKWVLT